MPGLHSQSQHSDSVTLTSLTYIPVLYMGTLNLPTTSKADAIKWFTNDDTSFSLE